jgi:hypothetical protein
MQKGDIFGSLFFVDFVLRPKLEKVDEDKNSKVDSTVTLEEGFGSST